MTCGCNHSRDAEESVVLRLPGLTPSYFYSAGAVWQPASRLFTGVGRPLIAFRFGVPFLRLAVARPAFPVGIEDAQDLELEDVLFGGSAKSDRKDFKISKWKSKPVPAGSVGFDDYRQISGVSGPWVKQTLVFDAKAKPPACKDFTYWCKQTVVEAIRVLDASGNPIPNDAKDGATGSTSKHGGSIRTGYTEVPGLPGVMGPEGLGDLDHHRFVRELAKLKAGGCEICELVITVTATIVDHCKVKTDAQGRPVYLSFGPNRVDYVILSIEQAGNCDALCKKIDPTDTKQSGNFSCDGKTSTYEYTYSWSICPCIAEPPPPTQPPPPTKSSTVTPTPDDITVTEEHKPPPTTTPSEPGMGTGGGAPGMGSGEPPPGAPGGDGGMRVLRPLPERGVVPGGAIIPGVRRPSD